MAHETGDDHIADMSSTRPNPGYTIHSSPIPQPVSNNREGALGLTLPENYTDVDMGNLLNRVMDSPELLRKDAVVTVYNTNNPGSELTVDPPESGSESEAMKDLEEYSAKNFSESAFNSYYEEQGSTRYINPAIVAYEEAQEKQIQRLTQLVTPLSHEIGTKRNELCFSCFHVGHHRTEFDICPAAHIRSLLSGESYYDRFSEMEEARLCLMAELGFVCQGLAWGIKHVNQGYMQELGIFSSNVTQLHALIKQWHLASKDEKFTLGKFKECGGEMMFGEPIKIAVVDNNQGPYKQIFVRPAPVSQEKTSSDHTNFPIVFDPITTTSVQPTRRVKPESNADRLKLEVIGNRLTTVCTNCFHRGHAKSSVKICPYMIISLAINKAKNTKRKKKLNDVGREVRCLQKVVDGTPPNQRDKVDQIVVLLNEWKNVVSGSVNGSLIQARKRATSSHTGTQEVIPATPRVQSPNNPHRSSDCFPIIPFQNGDQSANHSLPSTLNSPFGEIGDHTLYDMPLVNNHYSLVQLPPGLEYTSNVQDTSLIQGPSYPLPVVGTEFDARELTDELGMEAFLDADFDTIISNNPWKLPENTFHLPNLKNTNDKSLNLPLQAQQDPTHPPNTPMSRSNTPNSQTSQQDLEIGDVMIESTSEDGSTKYELPSEIYWRSRCPLKIMGNENDSFCKVCLHYGHNKRSHASCLINIVMSAVTTGEAHEILGAARSIQNMQSAIKWQESLPKDIQSDSSIIKKVVRHWEKVSENWKNAIGNTNTVTDLPNLEPGIQYSYYQADQQQKIQADDTDMDIPNTKRRRPHGEQYHSASVGQEQQIQHKAIPVQRNTQIDRETQPFVLDVHRDPERQFTQTHPLKSPFETPSNQQKKSGKPQRQSQKYTLGFLPETLYTQGGYPQQSHPQQPYLQQSFPQQSFSQQPFPQQPQQPQQPFSQQPQQSFPHQPSQQSFPQQAPPQQAPPQQAPTAPKGVAIDYTKMPPDLFAKVSEYILDDENSSDQLRINFQGMPPMLVVAIRKYILPSAPISQPAIHQPYALPHGTSPSHLSSIGQQYNNQIQTPAYTPKRKRK